MTSVPHFFVDPSDVRGDTVAITGAEAHHAARVLRVKVGERVSIADGTGRVMDAVVSHVGRNVDAEVRDVCDVQPTAPAITLVQGIAKGDKMDTVVQKSVEVGVRRIVPVVCERTIVRWDERKQAKAVDRWREVARAAAKQCRSAWMTSVEEVVAGVDAVPITTQTVVFDPDADARLRDVLPADRPETFTLVIGPEGGLSPEEIRLLGSRGAVAAGLGPRILRAETAGPVAAALILYAYGNLG